MIKVYPSAPYHYEVTGVNEKEAAEEFQERLDWMERSWAIYKQSRTERLDDLGYLRREICKKYGVTIR
jgi:hypothetical protein